MRRTETGAGFREFLARTGYIDARGVQPPGTALWWGGDSLLCVSCLIETGEARLSFTWQARETAHGGGWSFHVRLAGPALPRAAKLRKANPVLDPPEMANRSERNCDPYKTRGTEYRESETGTTLLPL